MEGDTMNISIEYCAEWHYDPKAASLAKALKKRYGVDAKLIASSGGVFEVVKDNELIYSKKATGRFPDENEIFSEIDRE